MTQTFTRSFTKTVPMQLPLEALHLATVQRSYGTTFDSDIYESSIRPRSMWDESDTTVDIDGGDAEGWNVGAFAGYDSQYHSYDHNEELTAQNSQYFANDDFEYCYNQQVDEVETTKTASVIREFYFQNDGLTVDECEPLALANGTYAYIDWNESLTTWKSMLTPSEQALIDWSRVNPTDYEINASQIGLLTITK